jgi:hypothetical protein
MKTLSEQMEEYIQQLMREEGYSRKEAEEEAYDIFIGADERHDY